MRQTQIYCLSTKIKHSGKEVKKKKHQKYGREGKILLRKIKILYISHNICNVTKFSYTKQHCV